MPLGFDDGSMRLRRKFMSDLLAQLQEGEARSCSYCGAHVRYNPEQFQDQYEGVLAIFSAFMNTSARYRAPVLTEEPNVENNHS